MSARLAAALLATLGLTACGGGGSSNDPPGVPEPSPPAADATISLSGVAAIGAALDGAAVSVSGPEGVLLNVETLLTDGNGRYSISLDADQAFPVLIEVLTPEGATLRAIVEASEEPGPAVTAHINPITDLVARRLTARFASIQATLEAAAGAPELVRRAGDDAVQSLLGPEAQYARFATDADFIAAGRGSEVPSVTDTVLDTLGAAAARSSIPLVDFLAERTALPVPRPLMRDPGFQVRLVTQLVERGNAGEDVVTRLTAADLFTPTAAGGTQPLLETVAARVPMLLDDLAADLEALGVDARTSDLAMRALAEAIARYAESRAEDFGADSAATASAIAENAVGAQIAATMVAALVPLTASLSAGGADDLLDGDAMVRVSEQIGAATGEIFAALNPEQVTSNDFSPLAASLLDTRLGALNSDTLAALESGTAGLEDVVPPAADVGIVQEEIRIILEQQPGLVGADADAVLETLPNAWNRADWNSLTWS